MDSQKIGSHFEKITCDFFEWLFKQIGLTIHKSRIQFNGNQHGFDVLFVVANNFIEHKIFIECKNYASDLHVEKIIKKAFELEKNYELKKDDLFLAINPRSNFKNEDNAEKSEPLLHEKFEFKSYLLDVSNGVKKLFALNDEFYTQLYGSHIDIDIDEKEEIERFKSILFSRKPFKTLILKPSDKEKFVPSDFSIKNYIQRSYSEEQKPLDHLIFGNKTTTTLQDILNENNQIFILGQPGCGKSIELNKLANDIWDTHLKINGGLIPIHKNLRNFTTTDTIESFLSINTEDYDNIIYIFDGIDEISNVEDFKSKFENFITKSNNEQKKIKYVVSCRTNVYEKIVKDIVDFKVYFLDNLRYQDAYGILSDQCGPIIKELKFNENISSFLENPFQLKILANYINAKNELPRNLAELWESYINERLSKDEEEKLKKVGLKSLLLKRYSKKISVFNELVQKNIISDENLYKVVNDDNKYEEFKKHPLLEIDLANKCYLFEHRNIQEFFAAKALSENNFENIIEFISIKGTSKTHPSMFNVITYLINLISDNNYQKLLEWLETNESELLLKADLNRIDDRLKENVFQNYFQKECIEKTHWISTNRTFEVHEIANFADCAGNYEYLIKVIKGSENHIRTSISAINVLAYFNLTNRQKKEVKQLMLEMIESSSIELPIKAECVQLIDIQCFTIEDGLYLEKILKYFQFEENKQINVRLLSLISQHETIDEFFPLIKAEFLRENGIEQRNDNDNVIRGNSYMVQKLILRLNDSDDFLNIIKYYFDDQYNLRFDDDFAEKIKAKLVGFIIDNRDIIIDFLKLIGNRIIYRTHSTFVIKLIEESDTKRLAIEFLLSNYIFTEIDYFLASIVDSKTIDLVEEYLDQNQDVSDEKVERFRNFIGNLNSRSLAISFYEKMLKKGRVFNEKAYSDEEITMLVQKIEKKTQEGYDLLFNEVNLLKALKEIFENNDDSINLEKYEEINHNWYKENGHGSILNPVISLLGNIIYSDRQDVFNYSHIEKIIKDEDVLIESIKKTLERNKNNSWEFQTNQQQLEIIKAWCEEACENIDFNKIINLKGPKSFSYGTDYEKYRILIFFWRELQISLPKEFLLKCLKYIDLDGNYDKEDNLIEFKNRIDDDDVFNQQIEENIEENQLFDLVLYSHINYAIKYELKEIYPIILKHFKRDISIFNETKKIEKLIDSISSNEGEKIAIDNLKDFCEDINTRICWIGIKILQKFKTAEEFCIRKALSYLNSKESTHLPEALEVLFVNNHEDAIDYFIQFVEVEPTSNIRFINFANYSKIKNYNILDKLHSICYLHNSGEYESHMLRTFFSSYISNLSRDDTGFQNTQNQLKKIKQKLEEEEKDLFYINMLIEDSSNSYINYKSKPYTFSEALSKIAELSI